MRLIVLLALFPLILTSVHVNIPTTDDTSSIRPYTNNPYYWQYKGKPVLLLGGTWQDNLFNHPVGLEEHLDRLVASGGNYVRNTMTHRNTGNVFPYENIDGKFNLDSFNEEYWGRFRNFLQMTYERDIIVQIEIFDPWDLFIDNETYGGWSRHPFNPANNVNYTAGQSGLPTKIEYAPVSEPGDHSFYRSVPELDNNKLVLGYQKAFLDKLLSYTLKYPHILYCVQNESGEELAFGDYWADYIHQKASEANRVVFVTDMRRSANTRSPEHRHIFDNPQRFNFLDIAQNSWQSGQIHYDRILYVRDLISNAPRPINTIKIYNRDGDEESVARFFRLIFAGGASARFHRPSYRQDTDAHEVSTDWGLGLGPRAQSTIRSARMLSGKFCFFNSVPLNALLSERAPNEAYLIAQPGKAYAVYFPGQGEVMLNLSDMPGNLRVQWLDIDGSTWQDPSHTNGGGYLKLKTPGAGHWAVIIEGVHQE